MALLIEMQTKTPFIRYAFSVAVLAGCSKATPIAAPQPPASTAASVTTKQVKVTGVQKMDFPNGDSALVLNYETDISIEDKQALAAEVDAIWKQFQKDVEQAGVNTGVIRATHNETTGFISTGKGYGFVFSKDGSGNWRRKDDEGK